MMQVGILGITGAALSNRAGMCVQRARATHCEQVLLKWCRDYLLTNSWGSLQRSEFRHFGTQVALYQAECFMCLCEVIHQPRQRIRAWFWAIAQETQILGHICTWYHSLEEGFWLFAGQHAKTQVLLAQGATGSWSHQSSAISAFPDHFKKVSSTVWALATLLLPDLYVQSHWARV